MHRKQFMLLRFTDYFFKNDISVYFGLEPQATINNIYLYMHIYNYILINLYFHF